MDKASLRGGGARCVLVVDDDEPAADSLARLIRDRLGCHVDTAYGGADAIDQACRLRPDAVVMDIGMPFVDGMEAGEILARLFGRRRPRLIALATATAESDRNAVAAAGFTGYLVKPVDVERLLQLLAEPL